MARTSKTTDEKDLMLAEIGDLGRRLSDVTVHFHQQVATSVGLGGADHKYLNVLFEHGEMTAGRMAEITGLTTGAITGVLDRLEKQGLISREKDPTDRRKVVVRPNQEMTSQKLGPVFQSLSQQIFQLIDSYTPAERELIRGYLEATVRIMSGLVEQIKAAGKE